MSKYAGKDVQVIVGGYDLTGDHNRITLEDARNTYDVTAFGDTARQYIVGTRQARLLHEGYLNSSANRSHPVLKDIAVGGAVSVILESAGLAYSLPVTQERYRSHAKVGGYVPFSAAFTTRGQLGGWGDLLRGTDPFTNSFTGSTVDHGVASNNGGAVYLHVLDATTTGAFSGEESVLATAALNGGTIGSERITLTGVIPRYVRVKAVRTGSAGDAASAVITLIRFA